jgi:hypothetical protein
VFSKLHSRQTKKRYEKLDECPWLFASQCCVGWNILW